MASKYEAGQHARASVNIAARKGKQAVGNGITSLTSWVRGFINVSEAHTPVRDLTVDEVERLNARMQELDAEVQRLSARRSKKSVGR